MGTKAETVQTFPVEDEDAALGRVVALLREARGMSREDLAEATKGEDARGISPSTVAKLEQGLKSPRPRTLAVLASALKVTTTDLYERADLLSEAKDPTGRVALQTARRIALGRLGTVVGAVAGGAIGAVFGGSSGAAAGALAGVRQGADFDKRRAAEIESKLGRPLDERDLEVLRAAEIVQEDSPAKDD